MSRISQIGAAVGLQSLAASGAIISSDVSSINEGATVTFTVNTQSLANGTTLYWTINNITTAAADFSASSGSFTINNNVGTFSVTATADATTEGSQSFKVYVRSGSTSGTIIATSNEITINDTSLNPTYTIQAPASISEGSSGTFNVATTDVFNGTTLYWTIAHGTTAAADFSATSGSFTITSNAGSFNITTTADKTTEGAQTFTVEVRTGSTAGTIVATSNSVTIDDTSKTPTYTISAPASINEGSSGSFTVTTTDVDNNTTLYWTINNTTTAAADFSATSGSFVINNSSGSFSVATVADRTTEGAETFTVSVRTVSTSGTVVATSNSVTINDTSLNPSYSFGTIPANINEGSSGTFNVTTTEVDDNTTLYWTINNTTTAAADFSATSGSFTITSNAGSFSVGIVADATTEGAQTFTVSIRTGSTSGTIVATSSSVTINDTSLTPVATFTSTPSSINEGSSGTFNVSLANFASGTLYWTTSHTTTADADFQTNSGSFTVTNSAASFSVTALADNTTEGAQTFVVQVRRNSTSGEIIGTSSSVTINDTSLTPVGQYMLEGTDNYTTSGGYNEATFTVPAGVTELHIVMIGGGGSSRHENIVTSGGGAAGGGGGGLVYRNSRPVSPGETIFVRAGHGGKYNGSANTAGGKSEVGYSGSSAWFTANGGSGGQITTTANSQRTGGAGGTVVTNSNSTGYAGGKGGNGYNGNNTSTASVFRGGGGGAGGYTGAGGAGASTNGTHTTPANITSATAGSQGGGGGGSKILVGGSVSAPSTTNNFAGRGGGSSPYGQGGNGGGGTSSSGTVAGSATAGGDSGATYGYGGAAIYGSDGGGRGVVRIMWGANRSFPSTNTGDM